jgi:hypothetical protein
VDSWLNSAVARGSRFDKDILDAALAPQFAKHLSCDGNALFGKGTLGSCQVRFV